MPFLPLRRLLSLCCYTLISLNAQAATSGILVFGDSLSAGYGLNKAQAWPSLLAEQLANKGYPHTVVNASISGETSAGGRSRLAAELQRSQPAIVIIELGANDGLRGLPIAAMQDNLRTMIEMSQKSGAKVLLVGMRLPPNYGPAYTSAFAASFSDLAKQHKTALVPFLLAGFSGKPEAFQADGIHPNAASQPLILETVWRELKPLLK